MEATDARANPPTAPEPGGVGDGEFYGPVRSAVITVLALALFGGVGWYLGSALGACVGLALGAIGVGQSVKETGTWLQRRPKSKPSAVKGPAGWSVEVARTLFAFGVWFALCWWGGSLLAGTFGWDWKTGRVLGMVVFTSIVAGNAVIWGGKAAAWGGKWEMASYLGDGMLHVGGWFGLLTWMVLLRDGKQGADVERVAWTAVGVGVFFGFWLGLWSWNVAKRGKFPWTLAALSIVTNGLFFAGIFGAIYSNAVLQRVMGPALPPVLSFAFSLLGGAVILLGFGAGAYFNFSGSSRLRSGADWIDVWKKSRVRAVSDGRSGGNNHVGVGKFGFGVWRFVLGFFSFTERGKGAAPLLTLAAGGAGLCVCSIAWDWWIEGVLRALAVLIGLSWAAGGSAIAVAAPAVPWIGAVAGGVTAVGALVSLVKQLLGPKDPPPPPPVLPRTKFHTAADLKKDGWT